MDLGRLPPVEPLRSRVGAATRSLSCSAPASALPSHLRSRVGAATRSLLAGDAEPPAHRLRARHEDDGLFGRSSATWHVHGDLAMIVGGLRALLLQTLQPLAMAAVAAHSDYCCDPRGRLHRTGAFLAAITFGTTAEAERAIARVRAVHLRVVGVTSDGRRYAADDPHLLTWVHVTEVDSFLAAYRTYGARRLDDADADRYVAEMAVLARCLGAADVPTSVAGLGAWLDRLRPELVATRAAREAVLFLLVPPVPLVARVPYGLVVAAAVGLLPDWARGMLGLPWLPGANAVAVRPATATLLRALGWVLGPPPGVGPQDQESPSTTPKG